MDLDQLCSSGGGKTRTSTESFPTSLGRDFVFRLVVVESKTARALSTKPSDNRIGQKL